LDELIAGLSSQEVNMWDNSFVPDIRNHLFEMTEGEGGMDLVALNIQRGRDHGIKGW
jgi:peroxidase